MLPESSTPSLLLSLLPQHVLLLPPASPGFNEVPRGWRTCRRHLQSSSLQGLHFLQRKVRGLLLPSRVYVTSQPTLWWIKRNIFFPCPSSLHLGFRIRGGEVWAYSKFPWMVEIALLVYPGRCSPSSFSATFHL